MSGYQTFPGEPGASDSAAKLASFALPPLAGKKFLDIGCNDGYFCGYAFFDAAQTVVGIDQNAEAIARANSRFSGCRFIEGNWEKLDSFLPPPERFDVILFSSAIHYASDQAAMLAHLMARLAQKGILVLEIGVIAKPEAIECRPHERQGWHYVKRSIDERVFPDWTGIKEMLAPYAYKHMGKGVSQIGDPVEREVFHIQRPLPYAILLTGAPASGKSTLAAKIFTGMPLIRGDVLLCDLAAAGKQFPKLDELGKGSLNTQQLDRLVYRIFESGAGEEWAAYIASKAQGESFVFDGFVPQIFRDNFAEALENLGFKTVRVDSPAPEYSPYQLSKRGKVEARKYQLFLGALSFADKMRPSRRR